MPRADSISDRQGTWVAPGGVRWCERPQYPITGQTLVGRLSWHRSPHEPAGGQVAVCLRLVGLDGEPLHVAGAVCAPCA